jgi:hypothetical protein
MLFKLLRQVRRNVVGYIALFVALGGTAVAAKPLITGANVQDGSITGADIAPGAIGTSHFSSMIPAVRARGEDQDVPNNKPTFLTSLARTTTRLTCTARPTMPRALRPGYGRLPPLGQCELGPQPRIQRPCLGLAPDLRAADGFGEGPKRRG